MTKNKALLFVIYFLGILCFAAFMITKSEGMMEWMTRDQYIHGDLYRFAKVRLFRVALPEEHSIPKTAMGNPDDAAIFLIGDSFSQARFGFDPLPAQLAQKTRQNIFSPNLRLYAPEKNPFYFLKEYQISKKENKRVLIWEAGERYVTNFWKKAAIEDPALTEKQQPEFLGQIDEWNRRLFNTEKNYEALWKNSFLTAPILEMWNTALFLLMKRMPEEVPLYTIHPPFMFFKGDIGSFYSQHPDPMILTITENIEKTARMLEDRFNIELIFMPVPSKYAIYHEKIRNDPYDLFLPRLCAELKKRGIKAVDLYSRFSNTKDLLYFPTDTHWNAHGAAMAVDEVLKVLKPV